MSAARFLIHADGRWAFKAGLYPALDGGQWPGAEAHEVAECSCPDANRDIGSPVWYCVRCTLLPQLARRIRVELHGGTPVAVGDPPAPGNDRMV
jgi:hypothetical protein